MQVALIGLTQSGKSSLFSAITEGQGGSGAAGVGQIERAVVKVPDERLDFLTEMYKPKKTTHATIEFLDLPGFSFVSESGQQEARKLIAQARQSEMLVLVICGFSSSSVAAYRDRVDPMADLEELQNEMLLADLELVTNRLEKLEKSKNKPTKTADADKKEYAILQRCNEAIENLQPLSSAIQSEEEEKIVRSFGFLTLKPAVVVLNVSDDDVSGVAAITAEQAGCEVIQLSATLESELVALDADERDAFLEDMGVEEIAKDRLVKTCYKAVNVISFLTSGEDEVRAWTIPAACPAPEAAGAIHSDIQRGFIRAEVVAYDDLVAEGDMKGVKAAGKSRLEGKTYEVQDGDIINFRFNV